MRRALIAVLAATKGNETCKLHSYYLASCGVGIYIGIEAATTVEAVRRFRVQVAPGSGSNAPAAFSGIKDCRPLVLSMKFRTAVIFTLTFSESVST